MKILLLTCILFLTGCAGTMTTGTTLAHQQDDFLLSWTSLDSTESDSIAELLDKNYWVKMAGKVAPSNLVIRQLCLIDILRKSTDNYEKILKYTNQLSYQPLDGSYQPTNGAPWTEGYSYWLFTYNALGPYIKFFEDSVDVVELKKSITNIHKSFAHSAYLKDGVWKPAPFGDLRDFPLYPNELKYVFSEEIDIEFSYLKKTISGDTVKYEMEFPSIGMNTHVDHGKSVVLVINGELINFEFYTDYDVKYKNKWLEIYDMIRFSRLKSIIKLNRE